MVFNPRVIVKFIEKPIDIIWEILFLLSTQDNFDKSGITGRFGSSIGIDACKRWGKKFSDTAALSATAPWAGMEISGTTRAPVPSFGEELLCDFALQNEVRTLNITKANGADPERIAYLAEVVEGERGWRNTYTALTTLNAAGLRGVNPDKTLTTLDAAGKLETTQLT